MGSTIRIGLLLHVSTIRLGFLLLGIDYQNGIVAVWDQQLEWDCCCMGLTIVIDLLLRIGLLLHVSTIRIGLLLHVSTIRIGLLLHGIGYRNRIVAAGD